MIIRYIDNILFRPFREIKYKILGIKAIKGNLESDVRRLGRMKENARNEVTNALGQAKEAQGKMKGQVGQVQGQMAQMKGQAGQVQGQVGQVRGQAGQMAGQVGQMPGQGKAPMPGQLPQMPGMPPIQGQMQGAQMSGQQSGAPGALNPNPPIRWVGFFRRRKVCTQCNSELDKTWDSCPYCAQAAMGQAPAAPAKTAAFVIGGAGGGTVQALAWLIPITGVQRGELFTLAPHSIIGTDPGTCQVVLVDQYMSSRHAEIKLEGGVWVLRDLGSTNGTMVNDKRVTQHELVDSDFIVFGQSVIKFKSL